MFAEIISVGSEILVGSVSNKNAEYLAGRMAELNFDLLSLTVVGDFADHVRMKLDDAYQNGAGIVIMTGAIGPNKDDSVKQMLAEYFDVTLAFHQETFENIKKAADKIGLKEMPERYRNLAFLPTKGMILENPEGVTPGFVVVNDEKVCVVLPNQPKELEPVFEECVGRYLYNLASTEKVLIEITLKAEAGNTKKISKKLEEILLIQNPVVAVKHVNEKVVVTISAYAPTKADASFIGRIVASNCAQKLGPASIENMVEK